MGFKKRPFRQDKVIASYYRDDFLDELIAKEEIKKRKKPTDHCERIELYQGTELPAELRQFLKMRDEYEFVYPSLAEWRIFDQEFWLPDPDKGNLAEQLILIDQPNYLGTCLFEYFAWCVRVGSAGNGDEYFATFDKRQPGNTEVVFWDHEEQQMPFYIADSLSSLAYANHLLAIVHGDDEFKSKALKKKAKRLAKRTHLSWHYGDLHEVGEFESNYEGHDVARYLYYRSMWIVRLLQNNGVSGIGDMEALFSMVDVPWSGLDEAIEKGTLGESAASSFYWLWRCFFFGREESLSQLIKLCRRGVNPLVDDMATLVEEIQAGRKTLGSIEDMHALRDAFIALDLDPDRAAEREAEERDRQAALAKEKKRQKAEAKALIGTSSPAELATLAWSHLAEEDLVGAIYKHLRKSDPELANDWQRVDFILKDKHSRGGSLYSEEREEVIEVLRHAAHPRMLPYLAAVLKIDIAAPSHSKELMERLLPKLASRSEYNHELSRALRAARYLGASEFAEELLDVVDELYYDPDESMAEYGRKTPLWELFDLLGASGDKRALSPLVRVAKTKHKHLAARALVNLGRLGFPEAAECALECMEGALRRPALFALARTGDSKTLALLRDQQSKQVGVRERRIYEELMSDRLESTLGGAVSLDNTRFAFQVIEALKYEGRELHETAIELAEAHASDEETTALLRPVLDHEYEWVRRRAIEALKRRGLSAAVDYYDRATVDRIYEERGVEALRRGLVNPRGAMKHNLVRKAAEEKLGKEVEDAAVQYGNSLLRYQYYSYTYTRDEWDRVEDGIEAIAKLATPATDDFSYQAMIHPSPMIREAFKYGFDKLKERVADKGPLEVERVLSPPSPELEASDFGVAPWALGGAIHGIKFTPDGQRLVAVGGAGGSGGVAAVFDRKGSLIRRLPGVRGWAYDIDIHPDGKTAAIGLHAGHLLLVDIDTGELLADLKGHSGVPSGVRKVRFSPSGKRLASASDDQSLIVWNPKTHKVVRRVHEKFDINSVDWFPDEKRLAFGTDKQVGIVDVDNTKAKILRADSAGVAEVRVFAGGTKIAAGGGKCAMILDERLKTIRKINQKNVARLRLSSDENRLYLASWDDAGPKLVRWSMQDKSHEVLSPGAEGYFGLDLDPTTGLLCAGGKGGQIQVWDGDDKRLDATEVFAHTGEVTQIALQAGGRFWTSSADGSLIRWAPGSGPEARYLAEGFDFDALALAPDGKSVLGTGGKGACCFDVESGEERWRVTDLRRSEIAAAVEGAFVVGSYSSLVWLDAQSGEVLATKELPVDSWLRQSISLEGDVHMVSAYRETTFHKWDLAKREHVGSVTLPERPEKAETYGFGFGGDAIVVSRWDRSFDRLRRSDLEHQYQAVQLLPLAPLSVSPDTQWLATGEHGLHIFDMETMVMRARTSFGEAITALRFLSPTTIAAGLASGRVVLTQVLPPTQVMKATTGR